jgi:hypothetical protein
MNLYILKLKEGKYYVGTTSKNVIERLEEHMSGRGSNWTKKYKVLKLEKTIENCDKYDEDKWTKIYMDRHGINNVRGGSYCEITLNNNSINAIEREVTHANDRCLYCHKVGHFIKNCPDKMDTSSKMYYKNLNYLNMSCDYESESDEEYTMEDLEEAFKGKEEGGYEFDGERYLWYEGELYEESTSRVNSRDGTFDGLGGYSGVDPDDRWKPIKKKKVKSSKGNCNRCGRNSHYASKCYAKKHIKGYFI